MHITAKNMYIFSKTKIIAGLQNCAWFVIKQKTIIL